MTQDEIIEMARKLGVCELTSKPKQDIHYSLTIHEMQNFAKLVAQHEREACAKTIESLPLFAIGNQQEYEKATIEDVAKQIRARGQA